MLNLIKLLVKYVNFASLAKSLLPKEIIEIFASLEQYGGFKPTKKFINNLKNNFLSNIKNVKSKLESALSALKKLEKELMNNPKRAIDNLVNKLSDTQLKKLSNVLSANNEGIQTFLSSSWIVWAIWTPIAPNSDLGTLTLKLKHGSNANPSGIYSFPLHTHPHGYGSYVMRYVFEALKTSASAGTTFWDIFYRRWYNYHRGINYNLIPFKNDWRKAKKATYNKRYTKKG